MPRIKTNVILQGDAKTHLKKLPSERADVVVASPPYYAQRDYGTTPLIWDGDKNCKHDFRIRERKLHSGSTSEKWQKTVSRGMQKGEWQTSDGFCNKCGAWLGQLGLEPTCDLFIKHLADIFDEVKRVLKRGGTCWVNLGDTYSGSCCGHGDTRDSKGIQNVSKQKYTAKRKPLAAKSTKQVKAKSLVQIPFRFSIEMSNRGWILRNVIIWHKPNCMPSSVKDRFTVDFEYLFFFSKNKKYYFKTQYEKSKTGNSASFNLRVRDVKRGHATKSGQYRASKKEVEQYHGQNIKYSHKRNKRTVWCIPTKPFKGAHFATYPEDLCETPIKAGCPEGGIVLDPFFGAGTTGLVALKQNKKFIGIELNPDYVEIAKKRLQPYLNDKKSLNRTGSKKRAKCQEKVSRNKKLKK